MWNDNVNEQTIALAGLYQSCQVVSDIAWNGEYKENNLIPLINCIMQIDASNTENIYIDILKFINPGFATVISSILLLDSILFINLLAMFIGLSLNILESCKGRLEA